MFTIIVELECATHVNDQNDEWRDNRGYACGHYINYDFCQGGTYGTGWDRYFIYPHLSSLFSSHLSSSPLFSYNLFYYLVTSSLLLQPLLV